MLTRSGRSRASRRLSRATVTLTVIAVGFAMVTVAAPPASATPPAVTFGLPHFFPAGTGPQQVQVGLIDGDANPDLITANFGSRDISFLRGHGDGTFDAPVSFATGSASGSFVTGLALADVDQDGNLDVITANDGTNNLSVLFGNGDGTFVEPAPLLPTGNSPFSVAVGDVDGVNGPDLVTANNQGVGISVLLNDGPGTRTFHSAPNISVGSAAMAVATGQLDAGGPTDVALVDYTDRPPDQPFTGRVNVLSGNGDGTFGGGDNFEVGPGPAAGVTIADVDGDGFNDIVTSGDHASVSYGDGTGAFDTHAGLVSPGLDSVVVGDMNGDLVPDLVTSGPGPNGVSILLGNGGRTFAPYTAIATSHSPWSATIGDLNHDGRPDLVTADYSNNDVTVWLNRTGITEVPGAPTGATATAGNAQATVSWTTPASDGGTAITGYVVTPYINGVAQPSQEFDTNATTQTVTGLANGTAYTFTVAAINAVGTGGASAPSNAVTPFTVPGMPTGVVATSLDHGAKISWTKPAQNGSTIDRYRIIPYVGNIAGAAFDTTNAALSTNDTALANSTVYRFKVEAHNAAGYGPPSAFSNPVKAGTPGAPTSVTATAGYTSATVTWAVPNNNGAGIWGYDVTPYVGNVAAPSQPFAFPATSGVVTGLAAGTTYTFKVSATNVRGTGAQSTASNAITPYDVPGPPFAVAATAWNKSATVSWVAPTTNGGRAISRYKVVAYGSDGTTLSQTYNSAATTQTLTGLTNYVSYTFKVEAGNASFGPLSSSSNGIWPTGISAFGIGGSHTCALAGGAIKCWGDNSDGELGDGTTINRHAPTTVRTSSTNAAPLAGVTAIAVGGSHTCALVSNQTVRCWGRNGYGQLGDTTLTGKSAPSVVRVGPGAFSAGLGGVTAISAGPDFTCALLVTTSVECWGDNSNGQLGDTTTTNRSVPTLVRVGPGTGSAALTGVTAIATGNSHTCALLTDKTVKCWGQNNFGQLGDGTNVERHVPTTTVKVSANGVALPNVAAISAGGGETCARLTDSTMKCWGIDISGEIGDGTVGAPRHVPTTVRTSQQNAAALSGVIAIAVGGHPCALLSNSLVGCWGMNANGEVGDVTTTNRSAPTTVLVGPLANSGPYVNVVAIAVGSQDSCALQLSGVLKCWGLNSSGQLGDNTTTDRHYPVAVLGL